MTPFDLVVLAAAAANATSNDIAIIVALISGVVALASGFLAARAATKANDTNTHKVGLEEHRDSITRLQMIISEQDKQQERSQDRARRELDQLNDRLASVQTQWNREQETTQLLRSQIGVLQEQVRILQRNADGYRQRRRPGQVDDDELPAGTN